MVALFLSQPFKNNIIAFLFRRKFAKEGFFHVKTYFSTSYMNPG